MNFQPPEQDDPRDDDDREQAASPPPEIAILKEQLNACVATLQSYYKADAAQPPQDERGQDAAENPWRDLFWSVARALNCLPSTFVDGNAHVYKQAEKYAALAASAPAQQATPPQPVAAEVATAPKLLLERAAQMCEWYAEFIRDNVMSQDIERHPYLPELEGVAVDLRALAGTGSDESGEGEA